MKTSIVTWTAFAAWSMGGELSQTYEKAYFLETAKGQTEEATVLYRQIAGTEATDENRAVILKSLKRLTTLYSALETKLPKDLNAYLSKLNLDFERGGRSGADSWPQFWSGGGKGYAITAVKEKGASGAWCARIKKEKKGSHFGTITSSLNPQHFAGHRVRLSGRMKLKEVEGAVGLWLRSDVDQKAATFYNMNDQKINGTRDWQPYSFEIEVPHDVTNINFGVLLSGEGTLWADDLKVEIVKPK